MASRLAGRSWDRAHAAKGSKAGLGLQALHVISRSQQQLSCGPVADGVPGYQTGSKFIDDGANHRVEIGDFVMQFEIAPTERLEGDPVSRYHVAVVGQVWPPRCQCPD